MWWGINDEVGDFPFRSEKRLEVIKVPVVSFGFVLGLAELKELVADLRSGERIGFDRLDAGDDLGEFRLASLRLSLPLASRIWRRSTWAYQASVDLRYQGLGSRMANSSGARWAGRLARNRDTVAAASRFF